MPLWVHPSNGRELPRPFFVCPGRPSPGRFSDVPGLAVPIFFVFLYFQYGLIYGLSTQTAV